MPRLRRSFDREFGDGVVQVVEETGCRVDRVARDLGVNEARSVTGCAGTLRGGPAG